MPSCSAEGRPGGTEYRPRLELGSRRTPCRPTERPPVIGRLLGPCQVPAGPGANPTCKHYSILASGDPHTAGRPSPSRDSDKETARRHKALSVPLCTAVRWAGEGQTVGITPTSRASHRGYRCRAETLDGTARAGVPAPTLAAWLSDPTSPPCSPTSSSVQEEPSPCPPPGFAKVKGQFTC